MGPLTISEGGSLRVSLYDPDRKYDPVNTSSPLYGIIKVGTMVRVRVDGMNPAFTGSLQTWSWDHESGIADLNVIDAIGQLSQLSLPDRATIAPEALSSAYQVQALLDKVAWPVGLRYFPRPGIGVIRGNHYVEGSVLDGLHRIRFSELGSFFARKDGVFVWWDRVGPTPATPTIVINCGGARLTDMWLASGLGRVRNRVVISGSNRGAYGPAIPISEQRSVVTTHEFLQFASPADWDAWANTILNALQVSKPMTMLGTIVPFGTEVRPILCSEFGDRWIIRSDGEADHIVRVVGAVVSVSPGWLEIDAVTEDL